MFKTTLKSEVLPEPITVGLSKSDAGAAATHEVVIGDRRIAISLDDDNHGSGRLRLHDRVVTFHTHRAGRHIQVWVGGRIYSFDIVDSSPQRATGGAGPTKAQETIKAPMPGSVIKINVSAGDRFEPGQAIIVMESMKMEMSLAVHHAGRVKRVLCEVGDVVEMNAVLAELEAAVE